jgi:tetratricopeptide (TPR) repeat protein
VSSTLSLNATTAAAPPSRHFFSGASRPALVAIVLALATVAVYLPCAFHEFITFDDSDYVVRNPMVNSGLTWEGLKWAFTKAHASNWHPLTWVSHMADCQLFGLRAAGHHLTNVAFHTMNSVLLFIVLNAMTRAKWRSVAVAALFALHPMHVESVAWIAERKDVLSTFFMMLTLLAYSAYARKRSDVLSTAPTRSRSIRFYFLAIVFFVFGLLSKPMLVTVPLVLCLLDYWPLARIEAEKMWPTPKSFILLIREKIPFLLLAVASSAITVIAQRSAGSTMSLQALPLDWRIGNALVVYSLYLMKLAWPSNLCILYPLAGERPLPEVLGAVLVLAMITGTCLWQMKRRPYLLVGWVWYVITLVPVIGLIQVGNQSMADRYTYIPSIGLFVMIVWGLAEFAGTLRLAFLIPAGISALVLVACAACTRSQLLYWQNTETLFRRALAVTENNFVAYNNLGFYYTQQGQLAKAADSYQNAIRINPNSLHAWHDYAALLANQKRYDEAIEKYQHALQINPRFVSAINNLGSVYLYQGRIEDAINHYREALKVDPDFLPAHQNLATVLSDQGRPSDAIPEFEAAMKLDPRNASLQAGYAAALARLHRMKEAEERYRLALRLDPRSKAARLGLSELLCQRGDPSAAADLAKSVLRDYAGDPDAHYNVAIAAATSGKMTEAVQHYEAVLKVAPEFAEALNNLAWIRATSVDSTLRNGAEAVRLALKACEVTKRKQAIMVGTLAAAYAEAGNFPEAIAAAEEAMKVAAESKETELMARNEELANLYRSGKPYRDVH